MFKRFLGGRQLRLVAASSAFFMVLASAMAQDPTGVRLDLDLKDADMLAATRMLFQRTGIQFVIAPSSKQFNRITLRLSDVTADEAIKYVCTAAGAYFTRDELGVYTISLEPPAPKVEAKAPLKKKESITRKITIKQADGGEILDQLRYGQTDPMRGWNRLDLLNQLKSKGPNSHYGGEFKVLGPNSNLFDITSSNPKSELPSSVRTIADGSNDIQLPGDVADAANQIGGGRGGGGGGLGGGGGGGLGGGGGGGLGGGGGGGGSTANLTAGQGLVPNGISFISYDPSTNSLIVEADDDEAVNKLREAIALFDVAPRQVQIKVEFISVATGLDKNLGFEFQFQRGSTFAGVTPGSFAQSGAVYLNYSTGNLALRMRAGLSESNSKVESAPLIRTLNNMPASVFSTTSQSVFIPTTILTNGGGGGTSYQLQQITAGTTLAVSPRINQDDTVTVFLSPQVGGFQGFSSSPDGSQVSPNQFSQGVFVVARVKNNETIVLGGLTSKNDSFTVNKVPILADLPIFGQFFRSTTRNSSTSELLIFVTPSIIPDDANVGSSNPQ